MSEGDSHHPTLKNLSQASSVGGAGTTALERDSNTIHLQNNPLITKCSSNVVHNRKKESNRRVELFCAMNVRNPLKLIGQVMVLEIEFPKSSSWSLGASKVFSASSLIPSLPNLQNEKVLIVSAVTFSLFSRFRGLPA